MRELTGTWSLAKLIVRRERIALPVWMLILGALPAGVVSGFRALYPTEAQIAEAASTIGTNPALIAFLGPLFSPTLGGLVAWRLSAPLFALIGIVSVLTMTRHTRTEEQTGRRELIAATVVGRHAPLAAALLVVGVADVIIGAVVTAGLIGSGLEVSGAVAMGAATTAVGWVFAGITAVAAQVVEGSSTSNGIGMTAVGTAFMLRVGGDIDSSLEFLSWVSPIGLAQRSRPFAGERWWAVAALVAVAVLLAGTAQGISRRRDVGAGLFPARPGPARAAPSLSGPLALALRLQKGSVVSWAVGFVLFGGLVGAVTQAFVDLLAETPALAAIIESIGGAAVINEAFLASMMGVLAVVAAAHGIDSVMMLRAEEQEGRAEMVLATGATRRDWLWSHTLVGLAVPVLDLVLAGAAAGVTYGIAIGDSAQVLRVAAGSLTQVPAAWVMVGVALALFGLVPRTARMAWTVLGVAGLLTLLGRALNLSQWVLDLSPFTHSPQVPGGDLRPVALIVMTIVALALVAAAFVGFQRRDAGAA